MKKDPKNKKINQKFQRTKNKNPFFFKSIKTKKVKKLSKIVNKKNLNIRKNSKESPKSLFPFFSFFFSYFFFFSPPPPPKKKCYPLSFPTLGGRNLTRAPQSNPFQNTGGQHEPDGWVRMPDGNPCV